MAFEIIIMIVLMFVTHWNTDGNVDVGGYEKENKRDVDIGEGEVYEMHMILVEAVLFDDSSSVS